MALTLHEDVVAAAVALQLGDDSRVVAPRVGHKDDELARHGVLVHLHKGRCSSGAEGGKWGVCGTRASLGTLRPHEVGVGRVIVQREDVLPEGRARDDGLPGSDGRRRNALCPESSPRLECHFERADLQDGEMAAGLQTNTPHRTTTSEAYLNDLRLAVRAP